MQAFLFVILFFPFLLHGLVVVRRDAHLEEKSIEGGIYRRGDGRPARVVRVENVDQIKREPTIPPLPQFATTNVLLEPRKRHTNDTAAIIGGAVGGGVGAGAGIFACCSAAD